MPSSHEMVTTTKRGLRRFTGVGGHGVSQGAKAKRPAWCGALCALQLD
jgi:hypothetical protein